MIVHLVATILTDVLCPVGGARGGGVDDHVRASSR